MIPVTVVVITGCMPNHRSSDDVQQNDFAVSSLAKTDLGEVIEIHVIESRDYLRELMLKLYKRNPRELKKSAYAGTAEENIIRLFDLEHGWDFPELSGKQGADAIMLSFSDEYNGDRVFSLVAGLLFMLMESYDHKTRFYLLQSPDPQNLYNCARNIEIAVWKLEHSYDHKQQPYLYTNSMPGEVTNLSFERLFGKLIALQDMISIIIAGKTNRTISRVIQQMASAVFLPIM